MSEKLGGGQPHLVTDRFVAGDSQAGRSSRARVHVGELPPGLPAPGRRLALWASVGKAPVVIPAAQSPNGTTLAWQQYWQQSRRS